MARIRTIKPDFWTSEQVMDCSPLSRLLFIGLWNFCDDCGRHELSARKIKAQIFPSDDISSDDIRQMLDELSSNGLIEPYSVDGKEYFFVTGWHHQKINRPQPPRCPAPKPDGGSTTIQGSPGRISMNDRASLSDNSVNSLRQITEHSVNVHGALNEHSLPERRGEEGIGKGIDQIPAQQQTAAGPRARLDRILSECCEALGQAAPADPVIGPMLPLIEAFGERRVLETLASEARRPRRKPVRTWALWAEILRESLAAAPEIPPQPPAEEEFMFAHQRKLPVSKLEEILRKYAKNPDSWCWQAWGAEPPQNPRLMAFAAERGIEIPTHRPRWDQIEAAMEAQGVIQ